MMGLWTMALPGSEPVTGPSVGWVTQYVGPREGFGLAWPDACRGRFGGLEEPVRRAEGHCFCC